MEKITFKLPDEQKFQLRQEAKSRDLNISILIRELIRDHFDELSLSDETKEFLIKDELEKGGKA